MTNDHWQRKINSPGGTKHGHLHSSSHSIPFRQWTIHQLAIIVRHSVHKKNLYERTKKAIYPTTNALFIHFVYLILKKETIFIIRYWRLLIQANLKKLPIYPKSPTKPWTYNIFYNGNPKEILLIKSTINQPNLKINKKEKRTLRPTIKQNKYPI